MKYLSLRLITFFLITAVCAFVALNGGSASSAAQSQGNGPDNKFRRTKKRVPGQYIVVLKNDTRPEDVDLLLTRATD